MKRVTYRITYRNIAAALAALLLPACAGGGGLTPLAPGAVAPTAAPTLTLTVTPPQITFSSVGQSVPVTAQRSDHAANATIQYMSGCAGVASVSPATTMTDANGVGHFSMKSATASGSCIATFSSGGASGATSVGIAQTAPTATPLPSTAPTATPAPGPLTLNPSTVYLGENADGTPAASTGTEKWPRFFEQRIARS